MESSKLTYNEVVKGGNTRKDAVEEFEEIKPEATHSSFECLAGIKSEEFDLLDLGILDEVCLLDANKDLWLGQEGKSSEFELLEGEDETPSVSNIIRRALDHDCLTGSFNDNASLLQNFFDEIQGTSANPTQEQEMALLPYGERAVLPYGERAVVPFRPVPIYSVGRTKATLPAQICASSSCRQVKPLKAQIKGKHLKISGIKTYKNVCNKCRKNRQSLNTATHTLSKAKKEVDMLRKHAAKLDGELLEQSVISEQLSATIKGLALDSLQLTQANETLYEEKTKLSAQAASLQDTVNTGESKVHGLEQHVADLVARIDELKLHSSHPAPAETQEQGEWSTATSKKTDKLQKSVAVQKKSIAELQEERQQLLEKLHQSEVEAKKLQCCMASTIKEKDSDISSLKDENYDLYYKVQALETKCQDCCNQVLTARQENKKAKEDHLVNERKLQQQVASLENALEAAKLIQQQHKRRSSVSTQAAQQQTSNTTQTSASSVCASGWTDPQDDIPLGSAPDIASGTPLDLSLGYRTDENGNHTYYAPSLCDSASSTRSTASCRGSKAPAPRKPRKFHFKVINPAKDYYNQVQYTPRFTGGKSTQKAGKPARKTSQPRNKCPHCLMSFPKNCDPITIQKHVKLHNSH